MYENQIVIIDNGSSTIKAGFAGEDAPRAVFPTIVGRPYEHFMLSNVDFFKQFFKKSEYIGDEAIVKRRYLNICHPINAGIVESWEDMENIWYHTFYNELRHKPEEADGVIIIEPPLLPN